MANLQNTESPISRAERNKLNGNWEAILENFRHLQRQINILAGTDVEALIKTITDTIDHANQTVMDLIDETTEVTDQKVAEVNAALDNLSTQLTSALQQMETARIEANNAVTNANDKANLAQVAADDANTATANANTATQNTNEAISNAEMATNQANTARDEANSAASAANGAAASANTAKDNAVTATNDAVEATENVIAATSQATEVIGATITATEEANTARDDALQAAQSVINAISTMQADIQATKDAFAHKGEYSASIQYYKDNEVSFNGSTYRAVQDTQGNAPTPLATNEYWLVVARRGVDGSGAVHSINNQVGDVVIEPSTIGAASETDLANLSSVVGEVDERLTTQLAQNVKDLEGRGVNVENFEILAPEVGEEGRIQRAIDYAYENGIKNVFSLLKVREVRNTITLKTGVNLIAYNTKFINKTSHIKFLKMESNTKVYGLEIEGMDHLTPNLNGMGIIVEGANALSYVGDVVIQDVFIHDMGFYGIYTSFAKDVYVDKAKIKNVGYAGFMNLSPDNVNITNSIIIGVTSHNGNGYGVAFTRSSFESLTDYPLANNCLAFNVIVENVPWEGFDTHAGQGVKFINCTVRNCKVGIAVVAANLGSSVDYASNDCIVDGCLIYGSNTGEAISIAGAGGSLGAPKEYTKGCRVVNNRIYGGGISGNNNSGSIYIVCTEGVIVTGNSIEGANESGIIIYNTNVGFLVEENTIVDVKSTTYATAPCINVRSDYNTGVIGKNITLRKTPTLATYVSEWAINIGSGVNNKVSIDLGFSTCTGSILGGTGQNHNYGTLGGGSLIYRGTNSPEGVITAPIGSIFISSNGGAGTTFYVKQTGTGNTGWVGK